MPLLLSKDRIAFALDLLAESMAVSNQKALATLVTVHVLFLYGLIFLNILLFSLLNLPYKMCVNLFIV